MTTDVARLQIEVDSRSAVKATKDTQRLGQQAQKTSAQVDDLNDASVQAGGGAKKLGQIAGQAGFQIQDFAVQVAGGQSALVAFGQQGSQLAGAFGPSGAIIGAIIAVSSALGGVFMASSRAAKESLEDLNIEIETLMDNFEDLSASERIFLKLKLEDQLAKDTKAFETQMKTVNEYNATLDALRERMRMEEMGGSTIGLQRTAEQLKTVSLQAAEAEARAAALWNKMEDGKETLSILNGETERLTDSEKERLKNLDRLIASTQIQADTIGMSARMQALYTAELLGANEAEKAVINAAYDRIEAEERKQAAIRLSISQAELERKALKKANDEAIAENERANREQEKLRQQDLEWEAKKLKLIAEYEAEQVRIKQAGADAVRNTLEGSLDSLKTVFGEQSAIYKAGLIATRAYAIADIAMNTAVGAGKALALGPILGPPAAALITALGAVQGGLVLAQTVADVTSPVGSRAVGGQVSGGNSYIVGERGPEVFTPSSHGTITPNQGGGEPVNITNVFQVQGDVTRQTMQALQAFIPQISRISQAAVSNSMRKGGGMSRAVGLRA